nr:MAG TPA: hypothetical protein [Caudoviricetes sp.]
MSLFVREDRIYLSSLPDRVKINKTEQKFYCKQVHNTKIASGAVEVI